MSMPRGCCWDGTIGATFKGILKGSFKGILKGSFKGILKGSFRRIHKGSSKESIRDISGLGLRIGAFIITSTILEVPC